MDLSVINTRQFPVITENVFFLFFFFTSAPSMFDLFGCSIFSLDSESDWLPESEPLPESLLPDWLLLLEELELEPEPDPDGDPDPEADSSSELLSHVRKKTHHIFVQEYF